MPCRRAAAIASSASAAAAVGQRREDPAAVEPARSVRPEDRVPVDVAGPHREPRRSDRGRSSRAPARTPKPRSTKFRPLRTSRPTPSYGIQRTCARVDAALEDQVLEQPPDGVVGERGHDRGAKAEAAPQPAGDVVLAAALGDGERARRRDAPVAGVEAEHHLAQRDEVVAAVLGGAREEGHAAPLPTAAASRARRSISSKRPSRRSAGSDPAAAAGEHRRQREVVDEVVGADASGRNEPNVRVDGATPP